MKTVERLWGHVILLCFGSAFLGFVAGAIVSDGKSTFQEWYGASSGWAAAVVGVGTIIVLLRQLNDLRMQTNFVLGNLEPTIYVEENTVTGSSSTLYRFTIENQNIRDMTLERIRVIAPPCCKLVVYSDNANALIRVNEIDNLQQLDAATNRVDIAAWTDRNQRKKSSRPQFFVIKDGTEPFSGAATFEVSYKLKGERDCISRTVEFRAEN
ncbi:hypothetical protein IWQ54_001116 [Labrenzia sp. EL_195]|nr:hypothetical protein [Labrenzia sp. EL_195]